MRIVACQQQGYLRGIHVRTPLFTDLIAEEGAPFAATFNLFDDPAATNSRGLWRPWSEYEEGEAVYLTPEGAESGDVSEHTPDVFSVWVARRKTQHSEPGKPGAQPFWAPMVGWDLTGKKVVLVVPGEETLNTECTIVGGGVEATLTAAQTKVAPSSRPYRLELREGPNTLLYVARGQIVFRSLTTGG